MAVRARLALHAMAVVFSALAAFPAAAAERPAWRPAVVAGVGRTLDAGGGVDGGGFSAALAALWPVSARLSFGVVASADDLGSTLGRLRDPNDGSDLGATATAHRMLLGGAWRADVRLARDGARWEPYATATWGLYRLRDDLRGERTGSLVTTGLGAGAGVMRAAGGAGALGVSARYVQLFNDRTGHQLAAGLDWAWR